MVQDDTQLCTQLESRIDAQDVKIDNLISQLSTLTSTVHSIIETLTKLPNSFEQMLKSSRVGGEEDPLIPFDVEGEADNTDSPVFQGKEELKVTTEIYHDVDLGLETPNSATKIDLVEKEESLLQDKKEHVMTGMVSTQLITLKCPRAILVSERNTLFQYMFDQINIPISIPFDTGQLRIDCALDVYFDLKPPKPPDYSINSLIHYNLHSTSVSDTILPAPKLFSSSYFLPKILSHDTIISATLLSNRIQPKPLNHLIDLYSQYQVFICARHMFDESPEPVFRDQEVVISWYVYKGVVTGEFALDSLKFLSIGETKVPGEIILEVREFEYHDTPNIHVHVNNNNLTESESSRSFDELLLFVRFVQMLLLSDKRGKSEKNSGRDVLESSIVDEDSWGQIIEVVLDGGLESSKITDWLLEKVFKEKSKWWILFKLEDKNDDCGLSQREQWMTHKGSGLGFVWSLTLLFKAGVGINFSKVNGWTTLDSVVILGREKMVAELLAYGAYTREQYKMLGFIDTHSDHQNKLKGTIVVNNMEASSLDTLESRLCFKNILYIDKPKDYKVIDIWLLILIYKKCEFMHKKVEKLLKKKIIESTIHDVLLQQCIIGSKELVKYRFSSFLLLSIYLLACKFSCGTMLHILLDIITKVSRAEFKLQYAESATIHTILNVSLLKRVISIAPMDTILNPGMGSDFSEFSITMKRFFTRTIMKYDKQVHQWLIAWQYSYVDNSTWEDSFSIQIQYPDYRLEDKPILHGVGIDREWVSN